MKCLLAILTICSLAFVFARNSSRDSQASDQVTAPSLASGMKVHLQGECIDGAGRPVKDATVRLYRRFADRRPPTLIATNTSGSHGEFELGEIILAQLQSLDDSDGYVAFASKPGLATTELALTGFRRAGSSLTGQVRLRPAGNLHGLVLDARGAPISNARVFATQEWCDGLRGVVTNEQGQFEIADVVQVEPTFVNDHGVRRPLARFVVRVEHPDWGLSAHWYWTTQEPTTIRLIDPAIISGRVVDRDDHPVPRLALCAQRTQASPGAAAPDDGLIAVTNEQGEFAFRLQGKGECNVFTVAADRVAPAQERVSLRPGETLTLPNIKLVSGGKLQGRVFDAATGRPIVLAPGEQLWIMAHSPARPRSGAAVHGVAVGPQGEYELRVPAGISWPYCGGGTTVTGGSWEVVKGPQAKVTSLQPVPVDERQPTQFDFTVRRR